MTTLKSFGCSFIFGSELKDQDERYGLKPSKFSWPALIADQLQINYECYALPGQGNFKILCDILENSADQEDSIFVINWTWIDRFDFINYQESWVSILPGDNDEISKFYYKNLHSQMRDLISNACYINSAIEHLESLGIPYIMTYMDHNLLTDIHPQWHNPKYLEVLQSKLNSKLQNFNGLNFLDWSRRENFAISKNWHPLDDAHAAAAKFWLPAVEKLL